MDFSREALTRRYYELCDQRDAIKAKVAPIEAEMAKVAAQHEAARLRLAELTKKRTEARGGGEAFVSMKQEIAMLAKALGPRIPGRSQSEKT